jgi:acetyltransferase-like isoleucine patch superfamily enzyme
MGERPTGTIAKVRRALSRDADLPLTEVIAKGLRFGAGMALAPLYLRDCDALGARVRTLGRPAVQNLGHLSIGPDAILNSRPTPVRLSTTARGAIRIGRSLIFNYGASMMSDASITVGDRVTLGPYARICDFEGDPAGGPAPVVIGDDVWLTIRVKVMKGSRIGAGTIVTAGSVVAGELPAGVIAGGIPARVIRPRGAFASAGAGAPGDGTSLSSAHDLLHRGARGVDHAVSRLLLGAADAVGASPVVRGHPMIQNLGVMRIGDRFRLCSSPEESHLVTQPRARLEIGDDVSIGSGAAIAAEEHVRIGDRVSIGDVVMIMDTNFHGTDDFMSASETSPVVIEDDVVIGSQVTILKGSRIGRGARIAPGSVVAGVIPAGALAGGVLARVLS